ncbi:MerR family transcriptional regulator [Pseudomonas syringae]|uniref:MerR family transcriptional regulator n=1 Tax=Pseudomonas syringae TaxID=317 RepID=A0A3T0JNY7_PSESX|nr:MerR family transcriptional regulator [Pseudomonas syringae]
MYIGQAAQRSGTTIKTIRHYESIGLLPEAPRQGKYRVYDPQTVELLSFIKCAQALGFRLRELQAIFAGQPELSPYEKARLAIADKQKEIAAQLLKLTQQQEELTALEASLEQAQQQCLSSVSTAK